MLTYIVHFVAKNMKAKLIVVNPHNRCYTFRTDNDVLIYMAFGKDDPGVTVGDYYDIESYEGTQWSPNSIPTTLWRFKNEDN